LITKQTESGSGLNGAWSDATHTTGGDVQYKTSLGEQWFMFFLNYKNADFSSTDNSLKKLTDIPATGLHLMSAQDGTTRNMASVETGFDPNTIVHVEISLE
jgi:hypothetical protein